jgi:hypothetical protein
MSGLKSVMTLFASAFSSYALRAASVEVIMSASGPAAAMRPRLEATARRLAEEGGRFSTGHGVGSSFSFLSPAPIVLNPIFCPRIS